MLVAACCGLAALSLGARDPGVTIEAEGVGSSTTGGTGCGCGPIYRARTVGGAAGVRVSERNDPRDSGTSVEVRGAFEREWVDPRGEGLCSHAQDPFIEPTCNEASLHDDVPTRNHAAVDLRVGFATEEAHLPARWSLGILAYSSWVRDHASTRSPVLMPLFWPEIEHENTVGDGSSLIVGTGSPYASTLRRPAWFYVGFRRAPANGVEWSGVFGWFRAGIGADDHDGRRRTRPDLAWSSVDSLLLADSTFGFHTQIAIPIGATLAFLPSAGLGGLFDLFRGLGPDYDASLGLRLRL